ncbi:MAG: polymerase I, DNA polymerase I protein [Candidatus Gottesmanbacteria bacterium GW2011_GWA2_43_14]|uniref:Polymerase I, DNA polymerase I protein n=1 Tax=Candidatus Gottesmanbacteria bacterium GW2011_GWA2_43_14 TaxID=1618443 RepID=A0A0G1DK41_9BACT|nr:MAG: polymerase I, DNA polymerase I protein [Candidatus Gottesmanbacteria bacterium GW2011_GWA2_43_14]
MKRLVVIDGHAILHRAYHALPPLITHDGNVVNAVYGFASMLIRAIQDLKPDYLMVAFDHPKPTFRKKLFKEYQSQRPPMETTLISQIETVKRMVDLMGIPVYGMDGFEADDVIGTIARKAGNIKTDEEELETVIITGDRDILQLVNNCVKVYMPVKGLSESKMYGIREVEEKYEIKPQQIPDFKALVGDASDNYPGVSGIGPKTAIDLIKKYGSVEAVYRNLEKIGGKLEERLSAGKESAVLSKKLAVIVCDVPIEVSIKDAKLPLLDRPAVISFFEKMEFNSLISRLTNRNAGKEENKKIKTEKQNEGKQQSLF